MIQYKGSFEARETARLWLRPPVLADLPALSDLHRDAQVRQYLGGVFPEEAIKEKMACHSGG